MTNDGGILSPRIDAQVGDNARGKPVFIETVSADGARLFDLQGLIPAQSYQAVADTNTHIFLSRRDNGLCH